MDKASFIRFRSLDFAGITIIIMGSTTPPMYYGMFCEQLTFWRNLWLGLVYACCLIALSVSLNPKVINDRAESGKILAIAFVIAGLSTLPGILFAAFMVEANYSLPVPYMVFILGGAFYITGAVIYAKNWPEKGNRKTYDIFGNSHNIFHTFVLLGALACFFGSIRIFHERILNPCPVV